MYIKRKDAIDALNNMDYTPGEWVVSGLTMCKDAIGNIPAADVRENKHGNNLLPYSLFECSVCGASCSDTITWDCAINFCPNCGAQVK